MTATREEKLEAVLRRVMADPLWRTNDNTLWQDMAEALSPTTSDKIAPHNPHCLLGHGRVFDMEAFGGPRVSCNGCGALLNAGEQPAPSDKIAEAARVTVLEMADGLDMAAEAEVLVVDGLEKYVTMFQADDRDPKTMRALRVYNEAKSNHRRFVNEATALRALAGKGE